LRKYTAIVASCGISAPFLTLTLWTIGSLLRPGYDQLTQYGSELATGQNSIIMNANFVITGSLIIALSFGLFTNIHAGKCPTIGSIFLGVFGIGEVVTAAFPCDPGCPLLKSQSLSQSIHNVIAVIAFGSIALAPLLISLGLKRDTLWDRYQSYSLATGLTGVGLFIVFSVAILSSFQYVGLLQRVFLIVPFIWIEIVAVHLLNISNQEPKVGNWSVS
jgi:Protein of unknown function (DUF998)